MEYTGIIKKGSTNAIAVKAIKQVLNNTVNAKLDLTNSTFGDTTEMWVKVFQKKYQLIQDGIIGQLTWIKMFVPAVQVVPDSNSLSLRAVQIADTQLFVREKTGHNDGVEVESYLKTVGLGKGYSWCMAFIYWDFLQAAKVLDLKTPVPDTGGVLDCWEHTSGKHVTVPLPGDQFIMDFGGGHGHTGIVKTVIGDRVYTIEGNTSADPTLPAEDREGNGVFERLRPISGMKGFIRYS